MTRREALSRETPRREASQKLESEKGAPVDPASLSGAVQAGMPSAVRPMLATLAAQPPDGDDWLYEIKWDGVRAIAFVENGETRLQSRALRDLTAHYPELAGLASAVRARAAVLDGEIVTLDEQGRSSFERLQQRMNTIPDAGLMAQYPVIYYVYDLIHLNGYDLRRVPLEQRKEALRRLLTAAAAESRLFFSDHQAGEGRALLEITRQQKLEGIIGKHRQSAYDERRSTAWQKLKVVQESEFVVGGYTEPRRSREFFGSLVLGEYRDGRLVHVGNAGSGFTQASQKAAWEKLRPLRTEENPFTGLPATLEKPHWVRPELTARVKFSEWTNEGRMRAPVILDVAAAEQVAEKPPEKRPAAAPPKLFSGSADAQLVEVDGHPLKIQNLGKLFFPEDGYAKRDVIEYYHRIADVLLPHVKDRPVSMKRNPDGIHKPFFFQKDAGKAMPAWVRTERIVSEHGSFPKRSSEKPSRNFIHYVICNDRATLVYLANLGCIEQNLWMSRVGSLENPDFVLFDLDPGEKAGFEMVVRVAQSVKDRLDFLGLNGYPKTSGSRGIHIYVPIDPGYTYDHSRTFAELVSMMVSERIPKLVTRERSLSRRPKDRVYLDFLQNGEGKTVPPPYSLRPRIGAPVSTPLLWEEVKPGLDPLRFNIKTIWRRLEEHGDLFAPCLTRRHRLEAALNRM